MNPTAAPYPLIDFLKPGRRYRVTKAFLYFNAGDEFRIMDCGLGVVFPSRVETVNLDFPDMEPLGIDPNEAVNLDVLHEPEEFLQDRGPFDWEAATEEYKAFFSKKGSLPGSG
jgi:hypothetical protein